MAHARTTIRQAFVGLLKGRTAAKENVYDSRLYTMPEQSLPAIIIFSNSEEVTTSTISPPRHQTRTVKITVECYAKATAGVNVITDDLAAEVERVILSDSPLDDICKDCRLETTDIQLNSDGDQPVAMASLIFTVTYRTQEDTPDKII